MEASHMKVTRAQVCARYKISPATIARWVKNCQFPAPLKTAPNYSYWLESDLLDYEAKKLADRELYQKQLVEQLGRDRAKLAA